MSTVKESIDVAVPVRAAYNQWTQFESFPQFMDGVERVQQTSDSMTHWVTRIAGVEREFDARIVEQVPDSRIAWAADGVEHRGVVSFQEIDPNHTRVTAEMTLAPEGVVEQVGDKLGFVSGKVKGDMERFKEFVERTGGTDEGWRGSIHGGQVTDSTSTTGTYGSGMSGRSDRGDDLAGEYGQAGVSAEGRASMPPRDTGY